MNNIPVINIEAGCLPEAWEAAVLSVWDNGIEIKTQYDKPDDFPSKDATVMITVADPFAEPRIHKNFPGGPEELEAYRHQQGWVRACFDRDEESAPAHCHPHESRREFLGVCADVPAQ